MGLTRHQGGDGAWAHAKGMAAQRRIDARDGWLQASREPILNVEGESPETISRIDRLVGARTLAALCDFTAEWKPDYEAAGEPYGRDVRGLLRWFDEECESLAATSNPPPASSIKRNEK